MKFFPPSGDVPFSDGDIIDARVIATARIAHGAAGSFPEEMALAAVDIALAGAELAHGITVERGGTKIVVRWTGKRLIMISGAAG